MGKVHLLLCVYTLRGKGWQRPANNISAVTCEEGVCVYMLQRGRVSSV